MPTELRLLVLEDEPNDAELEIAVLEEAGYDCRWDRVDTREDFLAGLSSPNYDIILSDFALPGFDGLTALSMVLEHKIDIPFILVSGTMGEETAIDCLKAGATDYVLKSRLTRLPPVVRRALREHEEHLQRQEAEERVRQLAKFPDESPNPVMRIRDDGTVLYCNPSGMVIMNAWGVQPGERLSGEPFKKVMTAVNLQTPQQGEIEGDERTFTLTFAPVADADYVNVYGLDITQRRNVEAQLRQAQRLESIGTLAGGVAHEINNPINGIMNYAQLILDRLGPDSPVSQYATEIGIETERVATIVRNLLAFARHEKQTHSSARIHDIVETTLSLTRTLIKHDQISLEVNVPEDLPSIECRSQEIQQVIMNLTTNARDALNEKYKGFNKNKKISISAQEIQEPLVSGHSSLGGNCECSMTNDAPPMRWIRLTVEDTGPGVSREVRDRMFDPFYTTKPRDKGTGLGLSISHGIVEDHGGIISLESEVGEWTRFHIDLPTVAEG